MTPPPFPRSALLLSAALGLAACADGPVDLDLRKFSRLGFDTSAAAQQASAARPEPDARGVISYPTYQVAVARQGDTPGAIAARLGISADELARKNALTPTTALGKGEVLILPARVAAPAAAAPLAAAPVDITTIAANALDRAGAGAAAPAAAVPAAGAPAAPRGAEPVQHRVSRGETAYSIARYYNVNVRALADWNGLGDDLAVREGQTLIIPLPQPGAAAAAIPAVAVETVPGQGSPTPPPPSAAQPLPAEKTVPAAQKVETPAAPDLSKEVSKATASARMAMPVSGAIIRPYVKKKNDGIDIAAGAGTAVKAAEAGTVAAITKDTDDVPILVLRHADGLLTVYANIDGIAVEKGASVSRGQTIAKARGGDPAYVHFEVRKGFESVDPMPYLQ